MKNKTHEQGEMAGSKYFSSHGASGIIPYHPVIQSLQEVRHYKYPGSLLTNWYNGMSLVGFDASSGCCKKPGSF